jgi:microcystin degradation protein MlrC
MIVVVTEFRQESNSLSPSVSDREFWESGWLLDASETPRRHHGADTAVAGMIATLEAAPEQPQIVYGPAYYSQSGGPAATEVMESYLDKLLPILAKGDPVDAVLLSLHGALLTVDVDDAEAEVARRIREVVGQRCVVAASTDLHGYITASMVDHIDVICGYHTYPHTDFMETGARTAALALSVLSAREAPPVQAWVPVPMMVSASGYSTLEGAFRDIIEHGETLVRDGVILDFSVYQMQPWLDIPHPHSATVAIAADGDAAMSAAADLAQHLYAARHAMVPALRTIDEAVSLAQDPHVPKPVLVVDSADSPNAGAPGDSMAVAAALLERKSGVHAATVVVDREAVSVAHRRGVGAQIDCEVGGSIDPTAVRLRVNGHVRSLHEGSLALQGPGSSGRSAHLGRTAVIRMGTLDILVCERLVAPGDPQVYRAFGIDPSMLDLVVVKANTSFRGAYRSIAGTIVEVVSPGAAGPLLTALPYSRLGKDIFPWVDAPFTPQPRLGRSADR